jgi:excisionase family DNA binding protein
MRQKRVVVFLTASEVGARCGVSKWTVVRWIKAGRLPASRPGYAYRVREDDVMALLGERAVR